MSVWLSVTNNDIAFAPNITPGTFTESYVPTPHDATLFPLLDGCAVTRRSGHGRKKPINHIPRPPNAFILFRSAFIKSQHVSSEVETNHSTLSKIIGLTWKNLPNEERQIWHARAKVALDDHKRKFPSYAFKPVHNKPRAMPGEKRRVREVRPKDHTRCAKIAELLVRGKKGLELEVAIQEFDKNHVPEIVTRFEAPITANTYAMSTMNNVNKRRLSSSSRHSQTLPSIDPISNYRQDSYDTDTPVTPPSFNQHSLSSPSLLPSFVSLFHLFCSRKLVDLGDQDFNTFTFPDSSPSLTLVEPLAPPVTQFSYIHHSVVHPRPSIPIPNTFRLMDEWVQSSSPISNTTDSLPTTPSQLNVPFPESYTPFTLNHRSDYTPDQSSYADRPSYPPYTSIHAFGGDEYRNERPSFLHCQIDHKLPVTPVTQEDMDFSTFMASDPFIN